MTSFKDLESPAEFKLEDVFSWGVKKCKFGGYSIPVTLSEEDATKITDLAKENGARNPVCVGKTRTKPKTIYLKVKGLTDKQEAELLRKGKMRILAYFKFTGVYTMDDDDVSYLIHKVTKLRKLEKPEEDDIAED